MQEQAKVVFSSFLEDFKNLSEKHLKELQRIEGGKSKKSPKKKREREEKEGEQECPGHVWNGTKCQGTGTFKKAEGCRILIPQEDGTRKSHMVCDSCRKANNSQKNALKRQKKKKAKEEAAVIVAEKKDSSSSSDSDSSN